MQNVERLDCLDEYLEMGEHAEAKFLDACEQLMNELGSSRESDRFELFWYSSSYVNDLDTICVGDVHELCGTII